MSAENDTTQQSLPVRIAEQKMTIIFAVRRLIFLAYVLLLLVLAVVAALLAQNLGVLDRQNLFYYFIVWIVFVVANFFVYGYGHHIVDLVRNQSNLLNELHDSDSK